jgi:hypothetical protein
MGVAWRRAWGAASVVVVAFGCAPDNGIVDPRATGEIGVWIATTGEDLDADGYVVTVDGVARATMGVNARSVVHDVPVGLRAVRLEGLASNCSQRPAQVLVDVKRRARTETAFRVTCILIDRCPCEDCCPWDYLHADRPR